MPKIRTIFQPDTVREVDEHEAAQLKREGLLLELEEAATPPPVAPAATPAVPAPKAATPTAPAIETAKDNS